MDIWPDLIARVRREGIAERIGFIVCIRRRNYDARRGTLSAGVVIAAVCRLTLHALKRTAGAARRIGVICCGGAERHA